MHSSRQLALSIGTPCRTQPLKHSLKGSIDLTESNQLITTNGCLTIIHSLHRGGGIVPADASRLIRRSPACPHGRHRSDWGLGLRGLIVPVNVQHQGTARRLPYWFSVPDSHVIFTHIGPFCFHLIGKIADGGESAAGTISCDVRHCRYRSQCGLG